VKALLTLDDVEIAVRLNAMLERSGLQTTMVSPLDDLLSAVNRAQPDVIIITARLLEPSHLDVVREQQWAGVSVVGLADVVDPAIHDRLRASGYTEVYGKPADADEVFAGILRVLERKRLTQLTGLYGESEGIREVLVKIEQIAPVSSTVLIEGESGTGKELVARAIHQLSPRRNKPFIAVNIGALPETLLESELFGHEKGAFTGAAERRIGRFELAHTGTLFLDEIGEAPLSTQVKLLRFLEQRELMRVGGTQPIKANVRVVAATNRPLRGQVEVGEFRADLYYRLNVLGIYLPPLRERRSDVPLLVRRFVQELAALHERSFHGISAEAVRLLTEYAWPGNVRELRNLLESMVVLAPGRQIQAADIPMQFRDGAASRLLPVHIGPILRASEGSTGREMEFIVRSLVELKLQVEELRRRVGDSRPVFGELGEEVQAVRLFPALEPAEVAIGRDNAITVAPGMTMSEIERVVIEATLKETRGNRRRAAEMLAIGERTLYRKLNEYQLPIPSS